MPATRPRGRPRNDGEPTALPVAVQPAVPAPAAVVWTPAQVLDPLSLDAHLSQAIIAMMQADCALKSINVKDPKIKDFKDYCVAVYADGPQRKQGGRGGNPGHG